MFRTIQKITFILLPVICLSSTTAIASSNTHLSLDRKTKTDTIKSLTTLIDKKYITADVAINMSNLLNRQLSQGKYKNISNPNKFAEILTSDIRSVHNDKHFYIVYDPTGAQNLLDGKSHHFSKNSNFKQRQQAEYAWENYGFNAVTILPGNIAYIDYRRFIDAADSKNTIASVMQFISHADAVIFDLRGNRGGDPKTVRLLSSYLFGDKPVHLNNLYTRYTNVTHQYWTLKNIDGQRMPNMPVYILTGPMTFSAAEEFTYDLQSLKRAVVIGENTAGGSHAAAVFPINNLFVVMLPISKAINPVTKKNWEGTGVIPNVIVTADKALVKSNILALQKVLKISNNEFVKRKTRWILKTLLALQKATKFSPKQLQRFVGTYGYRNVVSFKNGFLYYKENNIPEDNPIIPISNLDFVYKDINDRLLNLSRIHFKTNEHHQVIGLTKLDENGDHEYFPKGCTGYFPSQKDI